MIKKLYIAGHYYKIKPLNVKLEGDIWGMMDRKSRTIYINPKRGANKDRAMTVFHEALHGIMSDYGVSATMTENEEELSVRILEIAVTKLFVDNPKFTKAFIKAIAG